MFIEQKFDIPEIKGISATTIAEHLKLYTGYIKHANIIMEHVIELSKNTDLYSYELGELQRRFAFEWGGIRNHEIYFGLLEGGSNTDAPKLKAKIESQWNSFDFFVKQFTSIALIRGVGWAMLYYDKKSDRLMTQWVDEQHIGQLADCTIIIALDMWEHSYVADYQPSGKKQYIVDFMSSINWSVAEAFYIAATHTH